MTEKTYTAVATNFVPGEQRQVHVNIPNCVAARVSLVGEGIMYVRTTDGVVYISRETLISVRFTENVPIA